MSATGTPLAPGTRLGPYAIVELIGSGGMADVYRADDTRLHRVVAIKVLGAHATDTRDRRLRFDREARAVSVLSHPNICVLYDVGVENDRPYLVMEYVPGESLAQRMRRGPVPVRDALRIAIAIADALDHAHRQGVIHRDLKPANVMIAATGIKLVDFGLARLREPDAEPSPSSSDDTESITQDGVLLGTLPYMSPEQVEAKQADARSDLFALGAILYEMITARRAFDADSKAALIVAILERDPPSIAAALSAQPPTGGPIETGLVEHVVARCLAKQPDDRWQTAADLKRELQWVSSSTWAPEAAPIAATRGRSRWAAIAGAIATIALAGWAWTAWRALARADAPASSALPFTFVLTAPSGVELMGGNASPQSVVSPDGNWIAYAAGESGIASQLWVTHLIDNSSRPLPHTDDARYPFWSPDSQSLGFFANGHLCVTRLDSASSVAIADVAIPSGGAWGADNVIVFNGAPQGTLWRVSANGEGLAAATSFDAARKETWHTWPAFLPDGRQFLYHAESRDETLSGVRLGSVDGSAPRWLFQSDLPASYAAGSIVFGREGTVLMQRFDPATARLTGDAVPVVTGVGFNARQHRIAFSVSDSTITYRSEFPTGDVSLDWVDRAGRVITTLGQPDAYVGMRLSRDGRLVAVTRGDNRVKTGTATLWVFDVATGTHRVVADQAFALVSPSWSPDSSSVAYSQGHGFVRTNIRDGSHMPLGRDTTVLHLTDWSPDGRTLLYGVFSEKQAWDIWQLTLDGTGEKPFYATASTEAHAQFSPDGRWVLYVSDESGQKEIWVRSFDTPSSAFKISDGGGYNPLWRADGRAIYYLNKHRQIVEVDVHLTPTFGIGASRTLFKIWISEGLAEVYASQYAVSADGQRFLVKTPVQPPPPTLVRVNWRGHPFEK